MVSDSSLRTALVKFLLFAAFLLPGCASFDGRGLEPGKSFAADVEATMGRPAEKISAANGDSLWYYPRSEYGLQTFAVRISVDGVVRDIDQRLTMRNLRKLVAGVTTSQEAREVLGPPLRVSRNERLGRDVWEYRMYNDVQIEHNLAVQFSADGLLREVVLLRDLRNEVCGSA